MCASTISLWAACRMHGIRLPTPWLLGSMHNARHPTPCAPAQRHGRMRKKQFDRALIVEPIWGSPIFGPLPGEKSPERTPRRFPSPPWPVGTNGKDKLMEGQHVKPFRDGALSDNKRGKLRITSVLCEVATLHRM